MSLLEIYQEGGEEAVREHLQSEGASGEDVQLALMYCEDFAEDSDSD